MCLAQVLVFAMFAPFAHFGEMGGANLGWLGLLGVAQMGLGLLSSRWARGSSPLPTWP